MRKTITWTSALLIVLRMVVRAAAAAGDEESHVGTAVIGPQGEGQWWETVNGVDREALADLFVLEDVHEGVRLADRIESSNSLAGEPALREVRRPFHVQQDVIRLELFFDPGIYVHVSHPFSTLR